MSRARLARTPFFEKSVLCSETFKSAGIAGGLGAGGGIGARVVMDAYNGKASDVGDYAAFALIGFAGGMGVRHTPGLTLAVIDVGGATALTSGFKYGVFNPIIKKMEYDLDNREADYSLAQASRNPFFFGDGKMKEATPKEYNPQEYENVMLKDLTQDEGSQYLLLPKVKEGQENCFKVCSFI